MIPRTAEHVSRQEVLGDQALLEAIASAARLHRAFPHLMEAVAEHEERREVR